MEERRNLMKARTGTGDYIWWKWRKPEQSGQNEAARKDQKEGYSQQGPVMCAYGPITCGRPLTPVGTNEIESDMSIIS